MDISELKQKVMSQTFGLEIANIAIDEVKKDVRSLVFFYAVTQKYLDDMPTDVRNAFNELVNKAKENIGTEPKKEA